MPIANKVLGQSAPAAGILTDLYTVPGGAEAVSSTITVANRSNIATSFRIAVRPAGAGILDEMYLFYDIPIPGNDTFGATFGFTLAATDVVSVLATLPTLSFNIFGQEIT